MQTRLFFLVEQDSSYILCKQKQMKKSQIYININQKLETSMKL